MDRKRIRVSHITIAQAARFVGVAQPVAWRQLRPDAIEEFGVVMISADVVRRWYRERLKAQRAVVRAVVARRRNPPPGTMDP
jgi:hypothetical protein